MGHGLKREVTRTARVRATNHRPTSRIMQVHSAGHGWMKEGPSRP
jgi:hypothetical protein